MLGNQRTREDYQYDDVKALEYFLEEKLDIFGLGDYKEFIPFGLTSQDINNTAFPLAIKDAKEQVYKPHIEEVLNLLSRKAEEWKNIPMLSRTHGQPASPTRLGKEFMVFVERITNQMALLNQVPVTAKFGGASGNFNAHAVVSQNRLEGLRQPLCPEPPRP